MAVSAQLAICNAVAALFAVAPALADGQIHNTRDFSLATGVARQINVNFASSDPSDAVIYTGNPRDWTTEIELVIQARKIGSDEAPVVADALWVEAYARVMADQSLGGLVNKLDPGGAQVDPGQADTSLCRLIWRISCEHRTSNDSISSS